MFKIGAREAFREKPVQRLAPHKVPIFQTQYDEILYAVAPDFTHAQIDAFHDRPGILEMSIDHRKPADAVERKVVNDVAHHKRERMCVQACGAGKRLAATRARL